MKKTGRGVTGNQRDRLDYPSTGFDDFAADDPRYPIVGRVRATMTKVGETAFFDVYE